MKILIDMNLSPAWVKVLARHGHEALHWSTIGAAGAPDKALFAWAHKHGFVIFTNDLDFGRILALSRSRGPSVIQFRAQDLLPAGIEATMVGILSRFHDQLAQGALVTVDEKRARIRILPL